MAGVFMYTGGGGGGYTAANNASAQQKVPPIAVFWFLCCMILAMGTLFTAAFTAEGQKDALAIILGIAGFLVFMTLGMVILFCLKVADQWDRVISKAWFGPDGQLRSRYCQDYAQDGQLCRARLYNGQGELLSEQPVVAGRATSEKRQPVPTPGG